MPNWNSRGNADDAGSPTVRCCTIASDGSGLDGPHQPQHSLGGHAGVGIEGQHQLEPVTVPVEEIHDVAGLEAGVCRAPPVMDAAGVAILLAKCRHRALFGRCIFGAGRVGQEEQRECAPGAARVEVVQQVPQRRQHAPHVLVADRRDDGDLRQSRLAQLGIAGVLCLTQQEHESDRGIGEAQPGPRRRPYERRQHDELRQGPSPGGQYAKQQ